jgi:hypothetical protein
MSNNREGLGKSLLVYKGFLDHTLAARVNRNWGEGAVDIYFVYQLLMELSLRRTVPFG